MFGRKCRMTYTDSFDIFSAGSRKLSIVWRNETKKKREKHKKNNGKESPTPYVSPTRAQFKERKNNAICCFQPSESLERGKGITVWNI